MGLEPMAIGAVALAVGDFPMTTGLLATAVGRLAIALAAWVVI